MSIIRTSIIHASTALAPMALAQMVSAQSTSEATVTDGDREWRFTFGGAYTHRLGTDLDTGGDVRVNTFSAGIDASTDINRDFSITLRLNFGVADYSFGGSSGFGSLDPWDTIHTLSFGAAMTFQPDERWSVFAGPVFQFSRESGADWSNAFSGGAIIGATYVVHDRLAVGGGLGIVSQIEDNVRLFPILIIEWGISDQWRISSRGPSGGRTSIEFTGIELIWTPVKTWEFALGGGSSFSRFRLDDDTVAPKGVGEDQSIPIWLRASFQPNSTFSIHGIVGMAFAGEMELEDRRGNRIAKSEYDAPLFVGLFGSVRF